ncbi:MAG: restriction endonuclease subunit S [Tatlockia sp.]|jgi:type I restriction enzyme S subunit
MRSLALKKLGELSQRKDAVVSGPFGSNLKVSDYKNEGVPILRLQNIGKGFFIDKDIKFISEKKAEELKYHSFVSGDIALAKLGIPVGKTCIIPNYLKSGIITADVVRIRPDKNVMDYKFLEYFLNTDLSVSQLTGNISGATRPRVNLSDVRDIKIPVPPLLKQQRIVAILDEAFAAIAKAKANAEQNFKNAKELFESYLHKVFESKGEGWEETVLKNEIDLLVGFAFKSKAYTEAEDDILLLRGDNIMQGGLRWENAKRWKKTEYEDYKKYQLQENDIVLAMDRPWVKAGLKVARLLKNDLPALLVQRTACLRANQNLDNSLLFYMLKSKGFINYLIDVQTGIGVPHISGQQILDFKFNKPSINTQQDIVLKLDALSAETKKLEAIYQAIINNLDELKKSILQKTFSGELTKAEVAA